MSELPATKSGNLFAVGPNPNHVRLGSCELSGKLRCPPLFEPALRVGAKAELVNPQLREKLMIRRWQTPLVLVGLAVLPVVVQWATSALEHYRFGNAYLQAWTEPRLIAGFEFQDRHGNTHSLSELRGRYVLLNVWATWCPPCRKEMPALDRLKPILERETDIEVVALSVDSADFPQLLAFYKTYGLKHLELYRGDESEVLAALAISGIPTTLLIDQNGLEIARLVGPTTWDAHDVVSSILTIHEQYQNRQGSDADRSLEEH